MRLQCRSRLKLLARACVSLRLRADIARRAGQDGHRRPIQADVYTVKYLPKSNEAAAAVYHGGNHGDGEADGKRMGGFHARRLALR